MWLVLHWHSGKAIVERPEAKELGRKMPHYVDKNAKWKLAQTLGKEQIVVFRKVSDLSSNSDGLLCPGLCQ